MSHTTRAAGSTVRRGRVRHEVRDGLAVMVFSALASTSVALLFLLVSRLVVGAGN